MNSNDTGAWMKNTTIYEVNVRQYTPEGTFNAFLPSLPRLKDMGIETLWFMPVTPIAQKLKKGVLGSYYAAADYTSINPEFGTMDDFKHLVREAQNQGFKVIIDWVANHTGWDHVWTVQHPEYFKRDESTGDFFRASGMDDIIELDYKNPALRKAMIDAMRFWITETGIDGFRCDLAFWVELGFWIEAKAELHREKTLFWLGELDPLDHPDYMQVFDAAYSWTWMHKTEDFYKNHLPLDILLDVLRRYQQVPPMQAWFTSNHDENSWNGSEYEKYGEGAKALAVFSCTWPGLPLIYSGQELPNKKRLLFFEKDLIDWNGQYELHDFYKLLLDLHKQHPALTGSEQEAPVFTLRTSTPAHVLGYLRKKDEREVVVFLNLSHNEVHPILSDENLKGKFENLFDKSVVDFDQTRELHLKPWDYFVFVK
ncbi:MAG TPA: alpha-amylase family glycosyl hydrolase [Chitinophagaceae bacterium]|nr:alpha-amylase family glycosyl hydrolase [Chitinophagaceae bacterium]